MDSCFTCRHNETCQNFIVEGNTIGCKSWKPELSLAKKPEETTINTGDTVMVPRTGGYHSIGEVIEIYTDAARVKFEIGPWLHGKPVPENLQTYTGYKTVPTKDLLPLKEGTHEYQD